MCIAARVWLEQADGTLRRPESGRASLHLINYRTLLVLVSRHEACACQQSASGSQQPGDIWPHMVTSRRLCDSPTPSTMTPSVAWSYGFAHVKLESDDSQTTVITASSGQSHARICLFSWCHVHIISSCGPWFADIEPPRCGPDTSIGVAGTS